MDLKRIGDLIATKRHELGLSQKSLGEKLGVNSRNISRWERGLSVPTLKEMKSLATVFNINVDDILKEGLTTEEEVESTNNLVKGPRWLKPIYVIYGLNLVSVLLFIVLFYTTGINHLAYFVGLGVEIIDVILFMVYKKKEKLQLKSSTTFRYFIIGVVCSLVFESIVYKQSFDLEYSSIYPVMSMIEYLVGVLVVGGVGVFVVKKEYKLDTALLYVLYTAGLVLSIYFTFSTFVNVMINDIEAGLSNTIKRVNAIEAFFPLSIIPIVVLVSSLVLVYVLRKKNYSFIVSGGLLLISRIIFIIITNLNIFDVVEVLNSSLIFEIVYGVVYLLAVGYIVYRITREKRNVR